MNRNNFWIHLGIAVVVITFAAVLGQISRWQSKAPSVSHDKKSKTAEKPLAVKRSSQDCQPEVLVKFRPNVSLAEIKKMAAKNNDRVEDEIESVKNLVSIDDLDNLDAEKVAAQYSGMKDFVEYAEPNFKIELEPTENTPVLTNVTTRRSEEGKLPNDPMFSEQWALSNTGQNGGKEAADLAAAESVAQNTGKRGSSRRRSRQRRGLYTFRSGFKYLVSPRQHSAIQRR